MGMGESTDIQVGTVPSLPYSFNISLLFYLCQRPNLLMFRMLHFPPSCAGSLPGAQHDLSLRVSSIQIPGQQVPQCLFDLFVFWDLTLLKMFDHFRRSFR